MTKNLFLFFLLTLPIVLKSQNIESLISIEDSAYDAYIAQSKVIIHGQFIHYTPEELAKITLKYNLVVPLRRFKNAEIPKINDDGSFELIIPNTHPIQQIWLDIGDYFYAPVYLQTDLTIVFDMDKLRKKKVWTYGEGATYSGLDGDLNNFMGKYNLHQNNINIPLNKEKETLLSAKNKLNSLDFIKQFDPIMAQYKASDDAFVAENPSPYSWIIENERLSYYYQAVCAYHWGRKMDDSIWENVKNHKSYLMTNDACRFYSYLYNYLKYLVANNPNIDFGSPADWQKIAEIPDLSPSKRPVLNKILDNPRNIPDATFDMFSKEIDFVLFQKSAAFTLVLFDSLFAQPKADFLKFHLESKNPNEQKIILDLLLNNIQTEWCKTHISAEYEKTLHNVSKINQSLNSSRTQNAPQSLGQPLLETSFGAQLYRIDKGHAEAVLASLKQKTENKAMIIDFWATWCGPCIDNMPLMKTLYEETNGLPLQFVYICTSRGATMDKWSNKIMALQQPGIHIYLEDGINAELMALFSFTTFPNYAFIDQTGQFIAGTFNDKTNFKSEKIKQLLIK
jgi:thiol-disulfide isomerase/thioredoxin